MLVFFFPFFLKISAVTYTTACARAYGFVFERHQRSDFLVEKLYGMRARMLSLCMLARAARGAARDDGSCSRPLGGSAAKWTNVVWPIKSRQTNQQTNTHYSFIGIDELTKVGSDQRSSTIRTIRKVNTPREGKL